MVDVGFSYAVVWLHIWQVYFFGVCLCNLFGLYVQLMRVSSVQSILNCICFNDFFYSAPHSSWLHVLLVWFFFYAVVGLYALAYECPWYCHVGLTLNVCPFSAVQFMWDCMFESLERSKEEEKSAGCILAHCMGLGKTLSVSYLFPTPFCEKCDRLADWLTAWNIS